ncbi:MAG: hypothetical protein GAK30_03224 [Paracidovorax wautersii]|uniref:Acyltransferase 3 domain-containing protein n=1 Tax=Paracidovorax wautersii TaxID=1177982 RepID=A0A7V8FLK9_9BURK|nr:MAG: hypothetical protein GAK30_03224 [Paracidovorax wautersii]
MTPSPSSIGARAAPVPAAAAPRDAAIDLLRGWAIVGVVAIHATGLVLPAASYFGIGYYFRWAVPIFICAYAFYGARVPDPGSLESPRLRLRDTPAGGGLALRSYAATVAQRFARLALPFVAYSALYGVALGDWREPDVLATLWRYARGDGWAGQYFFIILFQVVPLLARWRVPGAVVAAVFGLYTAALLALPWAWQQWPWLPAASDRLVIYWLPYVLLGVYLRQNTARWRAALARLSPSAALVLLLAAPLALSATYDPDWPTGPYLLPAIALVSAAVYGLHERALQPLARLAALRPLAYLGRYSLVVFCLNPLFVAGLQHTALAAWARGLPLPAALAVAGAIVAGICATASLVGGALRRSPLRGLAG